MANMSYCRFENTLRDLRDCKEALDEIYEEESEVTPETIKKHLSASEYSAAKRLVSLCQKIVDDHTETVEQED